LRSKLYATAGACLAVAAFTLPGVASATPALAAPGPSPVTQAKLPATVALPNLPKEPSGTKDCPASTNPLVMQCQSIVATSAKARSAGKEAAQAAVAARAKGKSASAAISGPLTPADLQAAYGVTSASSSAGLGETVAIVDAFYDANAQSDLSAYRTEFGLLTCGTNTTYPEAGCLNVYNQNGVNLANDPSADPPPSPSDDNWTGETSLDVDMVSAICPNCTIDLIEANSDSTPNLGTAEDAAVSLGAKFVSNSWSGAYTPDTGFGGDYPGESALDSYFNHPGVATVFASGDYGYGASYPASSQFVTSVGGTFLNQNSSGDWTSTVWDDSGSQNTDDISGATASGCAAGEPEPSWGPDSSDSTATTLCANRTENDVSAVADAPSGTDIYDSADCDGYCDAYGTSVATPIITAMYALAGTPTANTYPASYLYQDPSGLTPVTSGTDVMSSFSPLKCETSREYLCNAADSLTTPYKGYNGPAGLGTPNGNLTPFTESKTGGIVSLANPGTYDVERDVSISLPAMKGIDSASGQKLTYSASGLPAGVSINSSTGVISGTVENIENDTVHVTAKDTTGASATVSFRLEASLPMTTSYKAGSGFVSLDVTNSSGYSMCMNDAGNSSSNGSKIQVYTCTDDDAAQSWSFEPQPAPGNYDDNGLNQSGPGAVLGQLGTLRIHSKCLNIVNNGTTDGSLLQLWTCNGGANELWEITGASGQLYNPISGKCIEDANGSTANGKQLEISNCSSSDPGDQNWLLPASPFDSAISGKCINAAGNSTANGGAVISYTCNGASNEKLEVLTTSEYAVLELNGKCLNATGNGTVDGTPIQLYTCVNSSGDVYTANLWYLTAYGQLENLQSQKCLAIPNNSTANSQRLELEDCYGEPGELWATS
jgi:hypothetical protein